MNQIIKSGTINFNELVKNSNTKLSFNCQSKMIDLLNEEFTEEESQFYIASLIMYLNYHPTNDFPVNLEHVFKMMGFANKGNAMKTIKSNFTLDEDYKITLFHTEKRKNEGGFNKETVMLNVDTLKNLFLIAKTPEGKKARKYFVKIENMNHKVLKMEMDEQKLLLNEKDKEIEQIQTDRTVDKKMEKHKVLLNMLKDKNCIYLIEISENLIKIGSSYEIDKRRDVSCYILLTKHYQTSFFSY
jgi:phage anti-repressor protein